MASSQQDKLFGLLAVQLGFLSAEQLKVHTGAFTKSQATGFGAWLGQQKILTLADVALLEACVAKGVGVHGHAAKALNALTVGAQAYTESYGGFADTHQSGEHVVSKESLEGLEFVVPEMAGRYTSTDAELGRGGLGRVLAFKDHVLGRTVAWKELHAARGGRDLDTLASMEQEARFLREARLAAQLEHPAIVPIYEAGRRVGGELYYTMRRIDGRTLADALDAAGTLEARLKLMPHLISVTQALAYAHSRAVLHRDVKPQNVMLGPFGETYLLDWGLAKVKVQATSQDTPIAPDITGGVEVGAVGTPSYMSPEQAAGKKDIDHRTDVWGAGAILYQVLTGRPPYVANSPMECLAKILSDDALPVRLLEPGAPNDLVAVVEKALQRDPARRYATAAEMAVDLQAWLEGRTVSAREYTPTMRMVRFARRHRLAVSLVAALAVLLVASASFFTWRLELQRREARALSRTVLRQFIEKLTLLPGAEGILDDIATPSLAYFRAQGALGGEDEVLYGQTLQAMGFQNISVGRLDDARAAFEECRAHFPIETEARIMADPHLRAIAFSCLVGTIDLSRADNSGAEAKLLPTVRRVVDGWGETDHDTVRWLRTLSHAYSILSRTSQAAGDMEGAVAWGKREWEIDGATLETSPRDPYVVSNFVSSSTRYSLSQFEPQHPEAALTVLEGGLKRVRALGRGALGPRTLRSYLGALEQWVMMLHWAERDAEAHQAAKEASDVYELLLTLEPSEVPGRAQYADLLLAEARPCESRAIYDRLVELGMRGDYFTSWLLSSLACGANGPFETVSHDELRKAGDAQAQWLFALWLVTRDRVPEAIGMLETCTDCASTSVQWPRGVMNGVPAQAPPRSRAALTKFIRSMEDALLSGAEEYDAFDQLLTDLKELPK